MTSPDLTALLERVSACAMCRQRWLSTGVLPHPARGGRGPGRALAAGTVVALLLTGVATVLLYRDPGSVLALISCVGTALMVTRDRARRCPGCRHDRRAWF